MNESKLALDHYRLLGRSGLRVSPLCLGAMTFGTDWGWGADEKTSLGICRAYAEKGGNFIDTANFYTDGSSEKIVGKFIASDRDRFVLATKYTLNSRRNGGEPNTGGNHRKNMMQAVNASLKRLNADYIDLYIVHCWEYRTPVDEVMRGLDDLVRQGKILYVGASDFPAWKVSQANTMAELMGWSRFISLQVEYSLVQRDIERDLMPMAVEMGLGITPWSPLGGGVLTGKYSHDDLKKQQEAAQTGNVDPFTSAQRMVTLTEQSLKVADVVKQIAGEIGCTPAQVALRWTLTRPGVASTILGVRKMSQLDDNLGALAVTLSDEQLAKLNQAGAITLGFPHDMITGPFVDQIVTGGSHIAPQQVAIRSQG